MRITIKIKDEYRTHLLALAARRGQKGFSGIVEEALALYFSKLEGEETNCQKALSLKGILADQEVEQIRETTFELRSSWR